MIIRESVLLLVALAVCSSCAPRDETSGAAPEVPLDREAAPNSVRDDELVQAAEGVIRFLRGERSFDELHTADTVSLRLGPDGGGARTSLPRTVLSDPANWVVTTSAGTRYSMVPPRSFTQLTAKPRVHFNCLEYALASRAPDLAALPHVGVMLKESEAATCLETWSLTLVFDTAAGPPVLRAAVYDQWEW